MLHRRKRKTGAITDTIEAGGSDSFLDIVSNIVGILIILVMIAGVRAQNSDSFNTAESSLAADEPIRKQIEEKQQVYKAAGTEVLTLQREVLSAKEETERLSIHLQEQTKQHRELFDLMTTLRAEIELQAEGQDKGIKEQVEYKRQLQELDAALEQIGKTKEWLQANRPKATVIENVPTPISKTVSENDKEVHFRLLNGKVSHVPFPELMEKMRSEVIQNQNRYKKEKSTEGRVGPVGDYYLDFLIACYDAPMKDSYGVGVGKYIELEYAELMPVNESVGKPLSEALASAQSELLQRLRSYRQDIYTVTVWVYPDSYEEYREFKKFLYNQGYRVAGRPLEFGSPISGSPRGTRSAAQ